MKIRSTLLFVAQSVTIGLAIAFLVTLFWPELLRREPALVAVQESAPMLRLGGSGPGSYASAVEQAAPAVVNINTAKVVVVQDNSDPTRRFLLGEDSGAPRRQIVTSLGSGVILSKQGYLLTNHHVISGADAIQVTLRDGRTARAKLVGSDPETDIAVLKIDLKNLPVITLGQSDHMRIGDVVLAIGNAYGIGQTVTMGIVSATGRSQLGINTFENFIQTDAAINPGNSGGALVDSQGHLIGINSAIFSQSGGSVGIGFAIPTSLAKSIMEQIIEHGRPLRGWLGVEAQALTPQVAEAFQVSKDLRGMFVTGVYRDGPAHRAGIQPGDVLIGIDGKRIEDGRTMLMAISAHKPGQDITVELVRQGKTQQLVAKAGERPANANARLPARRQ
jgi:serine protease DegS